LGVSAVTIRADLAYLEDQGLIVRSSGTARPAVSRHVHGDAQIAPPPPASRALLLTAASLAKGHGTLLIGPGRLPAMLPAYLPPFPDLRVVLTSVDALLTARQFVVGPIHILGGQLEANGMLIDGPAAMHGLAFHAIDLFILQASAITRDAVILSSDASASFQRTAAQAARRTAILISGTQLDRSADAPRLPLSSVEYVILSETADEKTFNTLEEAGFCLQPSSNEEARLYKTTMKKSYAPAERQEPADCG
jgi:DeoR/GlpR family transcriptional regulator of sugar metabolism